VTKFARIFLIFNGAILLCYAVVFLIKPATLGEIVGFTPHSPNAAVEVTAFYGGLEFGLAAFLIWSAARESRLKSALALFVFAFLAAGVARLAGIFLYGFEDPSQPFVAALEISFSLLAAWLRTRLRA
jgi:hypothetical protein